MSVREKTQDQRPDKTTTMSAVRTPSSYPSSHKCHLPGSRADVRVPYREVTLSETRHSDHTESNPPIPVYDTSGPYTDPRIQILVEYFIGRYARKAGKTFRRVSKRTLDCLQSYPWPGNVRELRNVIEGSMIVSDTDEFTIDESWLSAEPAIKSRVGLSGALATHEKAIIEEALRASGGRVYGPSGAAARLGVPRTTLESKIRTLGINKSRFRARRAKHP